MKPHSFRCACCGRLRPLSKQVSVGSDTLCWSCAEEHTTLCDRCGNRVYRREAFRYRGQILCQQCYDQVFNQ